MRLSQIIDRRISFISNNRSICLDFDCCFTSVLTRSWSHVEQSVILPWCDIGRNARLKKVVLDRGVKIPPGLVVGEDPALDAKRFRRTDKGVCLITQPMIDRLAL